MQGIRPNSLAPSKLELDSSSLSTPSSVVPRSPNADSMRSSSPSNKLKIQTPQEAAIQLEKEIRSLLETLPNDISLGFKESLTRYTDHLQQQIAQRQTSSTNWLELSPRDIKHEIGKTYDNAVEVLKKLTQTTLTQEAITVSKPRGDLREFCQRHHDTLPMKTFLMDFDQFIQKLPPSSEQKQGNALNIFPPPQGDEKYGYCVAGMGNSLSDALQILDEPSQFSLLFRQAIDECTFDNKIYDLVYQGNHIHVPAFLLSLFLPRDLIQKLDHAFLSPQGDVPASIIHNLLSYLPTQLSKVGHAAVQETIDNQCKQLCKNLESTLTALSELKGTAITLDSVKKLPAIEYFNMDASDFLSDHMADDYESINLNSACTVLYKKSIEKFKALTNKFQPTEKPPIVSSYEDIFNKDLPENYEQLINKLFVVSLDAPGSSPVLFIQLIKKLAGAPSTFDEGLVKLAQDTAEMVEERPDLKQRLERIGARSDWIKSEHSSFSHLIDQTSASLTDLIRGRGMYSDINDAIQTEI
ncbi:MAG: hypothetical protein V4629_03450, partial [Pseudomonadota bacterium]